MERNIIIDMATAAMMNMVGQIAALDEKSAELFGPLARRLLAGEKQ